MYSLINTFHDLDDPRHHRTRKHELIAILVIALLGVMCGANTWVEIATFGRSREAWLRGFIPLDHGTPSHDTFGRVFARLDPTELQQRFLSWMSILLQRISGQHVAIDGKTVCGSYESGNRNSAIHLVNAWATGSALFFGQLKTQAKSNEITAIPELLASLEIAGCLVSIDAMGCQVAIAQQILDQKAHYLLAIKGNQPTMHQAVQQAFDHIDAAQEIPQLAAAQIPPPAHGFEETEEVGHHRDDIRRVWSMDIEVAHRIWDVDQRKEAARWPKVKTLVCIESERRVLGKKKQIYHRHFMSSEVLNAKQAGHAARAHWGIENGLHWRLDVIFGEDDSRVRIGHAPENFSLLRKIALNAIKTHPSKGSIRVKRFRAALNPDLLLEYLKGVENPKNPPHRKQRTSRSP